MIQSRSEGCRRCSYFVAVRIYVDFFARMRIGGAMLIYMRRNLVTHCEAKLEYGRADKNYVFLCGDVLTRVKTFFQGKILTTALFSVMMLNKRLSRRQIFSLIVSRF